LAAAATMDMINNIDNGFTTTSRQLWRIRLDNIMNVFFLVVRWSAPEVC
jgi:hypothetical protein